MRPQAGVLTAKLGSDPSVGQRQADLRDPDLVHMPIASGDAAGVVGATPETVNSPPAHPRNKYVDLCSPVTLNAQQSYRRAGALLRLRLAPRLSFLRGHAAGPTISLGYIYPGGSTESPGASPTPKEVATLRKKSILCARCRLRFRCFGCELGAEGNFRGSEPPSRISTIGQLRK